MSKNTLERNVLAEKWIEGHQIQNYGRVKLIKYPLSSADALSLGRPLGSHEMVLSLDSEYESKTTAPRASWYLTEQEYRDLFQSVRHLLHFNNIARALDCVLDEKDAERMRMIGIKMMSYSAFSYEFIEQSAK